MARRAKNADTSWMTSKRLAEDVDAFLSKGGRITVLPSNASALDDHGKYNGRKHGPKKDGDRE